MVMCSPRNVAHKALRLFSKEAVTSFPIPTPSKNKKAVKHIFMSNNYSNDTDTAPVATGSQRLSLHIEKKIKF